MLLKKDFLRGCRATLIQGREQMRKLDSKNHPAWIRSFQILILQIFFGYFFNSIGHERLSSPEHIESASPPEADVDADIQRPPLRAMCGRLRVGKENLHVAGLVGAAMCSACLCGSHDRWP